MLKATFETWQRDAEAAMRAAEAIDGETHGITIAVPAKESRVAEVERALGVQIPASFRRVLVECASTFEFGWRIEADDVPFRDIFCGEMSFDLDKVVEAEAGRRTWVADVFEDPTNPYERVWHDKLAFHALINGDYLAFDLARPGAPIVYLSHDGGPGNGFVLGADFVDTFTRWTKLGCVGPEDWRWTPFTPDAASGLDPECANAKTWREWFGIDRYR